jgi:hypothetical protein
LRHTPYTSANHLILELRAIAQRLGKTPSCQDVHRLHKDGKAHPIRHYYRIFGSFNEAIEKAGLKYRSDRALDREKLLQELRILHAKLKRPVRLEDVIKGRDKGTISPLNRFQQVFGSVPKAIWAAGVGRKKYDRKEMIEIIQKLDAQLDRQVTSSDIQALFHANAGPSLVSIEREFGGMVKARIAAGVKNIFSQGCRPMKFWPKYKPEVMISQLK